MAVWTSAGGGTATVANGALGVNISCLPTSTVAAPSGAEITLGHFVDTLE